MSCHPFSRTKRTVVKAGLEPGYGIRANSLTDIPIYDSFNLVSESAIIKTVTEDVDKTVSAKTTYGGTAEAWQGNLFLFGSGVPQEPPPWSVMFELCGMRRLFDGTGTKFLPNINAANSGTIETYLNSFRHVLTGARGTFSLSADAGLPIKAQFGFRGQYRREFLKGVPNPAYAPVVALPSLFKGAALDIRSEDGQRFNRPFLKAFFFTYGAGLTDIIEDEDNDDALRVDYAEEPQPQLGLTIEVATDRNYFLDVSDSKAFSINFLLGDTPLRRWKISTDPSPERFSARLAQHPTYTDLNGIRTFNLIFDLQGGSEFVELKHF